MNDNDIMELADIVSSGEECDCDEREMMEWCGGFGSCIDCKNTVIQALLSMLRDGPLDRANEVYVVYRRAEHGDINDMSPSLLERIFYDHDKAVKWVTSHEMTLEPRLHVSADGMELYTYYYEGFPIADERLPQYVIRRCRIE